jgi:hypothetical protein
MFLAGSVTAVWLCFLSSSFRIQIAPGYQLDGYCRAFLPHPDRLRGQYEALDGKQLLPAGFILLDTALHSAARNGPGHPSRASRQIVGHDCLSLQVK